MVKQRKIIIIVTLCVLLFPAVGAVEAQPDYNGSVTFGYVGFDDEGNRSAASELYDTYDGLSLSNLTLNGNINPRTRYYLNLSDINFDGRRGSLDITNYDYYSIKANYRQTRGIFGDGDNLSVDRKFYSGLFRVKPVRYVEGYFQYRGSEDEGDRVIYGIDDQGLFGDSYDRNTTFYKGGLKLKHLGNHVDLFYGVRDFDDNLSDSLDAETEIMGASIFFNAHSRVNAIIDYHHLKAKKEISENYIKEDRLSFSFLTNPVENLTITPRGHYRKIDEDPADVDSESYTGELIGDYRLVNYNSNLSASIGYEIRDAQDDRATAVAYSAGVQGKPHQYIGFKVKYDNHRRRDTYEALLTGYEDRINLVSELHLYPMVKSKIKAGYRYRVRENEDIATQGKTQGLYLKANGYILRWIRLYGAISIDDIDYTSPLQDYNYLMQLLSGQVQLSLSRKINLTLRGTYLDFDHDIESTKMDVDAAVSYRIINNLGLNASYRRYELDSYSLSPHYYEANLFRITATFYFENQHYSQ
ncbi:MAG: hypothetical protein GF315_00365 [candidate division Zixibacteria bacterium]|nr:hypothetical protein [candidate division Zixibacteria bacterium]